MDRARGIRAGLEVKVFISHYSKDGAEVDSILKAVYDELVTQNWEVFLDASVLQVGDDWRTEIYLHLNECRAAILFISKEGLSSWWVRREIEILLWRRWLRSSVLIIPVLIGGLKRDEIGVAGFSELNSIQYARLAGDDTVREIADRLAKLSDRTSGDERINSWLDRICEDLGEVTDAGRLAEAAEKFGLSAEDINAIRGGGLASGQRFIASHLLSSGLSEKLSPAIETFANLLSADRLRRLVSIIEPAWVDPGAARFLLAPPSGPHRMIVLLSAQEPQTAEQYYKRATCCAMNGYGLRSVGSVDVGETARAPKSVELLEAQYRRMLGFLYYGGWTSAKEPPPPENKRQHYLIVDAEPCDFRAAVSAVRNIQNRHDRLIVIMLTGEIDDDTIHDLGLDNCIQPEPLLSYQRELDGLSLTNELRELHDNVTAQRG